MQTTSKINKAGVSLIAVLLFMLIATIAATATWKWISSEGRSSASRMLKREAYQSSIAGIENTRAWMTFHGNDVGALIKQYYDNGNQPIKLNNRLTPWLRADQNYDVWLTGVNTESAHNFKLKILSRGTSRGSSVHTEAAVLNVDGLYRVKIPSESIPMDFDKAFSGTLTNMTNSPTIESAIVNGDFSGNQPSVDKELVVTGNVTLQGPVNGAKGLAGADLYVKGNLTLNGNTNIGGPGKVAYVGGDVVKCEGGSEFHPKGDFLVEGSFPADCNIEIDGNMTVGGTLYRDGADRRFKIGKNLVFKKNGDFNWTGVSTLVGGAGTHKEGVGKKSYLASVSGKDASDNRIVNLGTDIYLYSSFPAQNCQNGCVISDEVHMNSCTSRCAGGTGLEANTYCEGFFTSCAEKDYGTYRSTIGIPDNRYFSFKSPGSNGRVRPTRISSWDRNDNVLKDIGDDYWKNIDKMNAYGRLIKEETNTIPQPVLLKDSTTWAQKSANARCRELGFLKVDKSNAGKIANGDMQNDDSVWVDLNDCYQKLSNEGDPILYNGFMVVKFDGGAGMNMKQTVTEVLRGKYVFFFESQISGAFYLPPTTEETTIMLFTSRGGGTLYSAKTDPEHMGPYVFNYFIYADGGTESQLEFKELQINGSVVMANGSKAAISDGGVHLNYNSKVLSDLAQAGIIEQNPEYTAVVNGDESAAGGSGVSVAGGHDAYFIATAPQLHVTLVSQSESSEEAPSGAAANVEVATSFIVLPRVIYLPKNPYGKLGDYFSVVNLNGGAVTKSMTNVSGCTEIPKDPNLLYNRTEGATAEYLAPGLYECKYTANSQEVPFYVRVQNETVSNAPFVHFTASHQDMSANYEAPLKLEYISTTGAEAFEVTISKPTGLPESWVVTPQAPLKAGTTCDDASPECTFALHFDDQSPLTLFTVKTIDAVSGTVDFQIVNCSGCQPENPSSETFSISNSVTVNRFGIAEYCGVGGPGHGKSVCEQGGSYYEMAQADWPDCPSTGTWVKAVGTDASVTNNCSASATNPNDAWTCGRSSDLKLSAIASGVPVGCSAIVPSYTLPMSALEADHSYSLYGSLKRDKVNFHVDFKGDRLSGKIIRVSSNRFGATYQTCAYSSAGCDFTLFSGDNITFTADDDLAYWKCDVDNSTDCKETGNNTGETFTVNALTGNNRVEAWFYQKDQHCFFDEFKTARECTASGTENEWKYCFDYCSSSGDCAIGNGTFNGYAKWLVMGNSTLRDRLQYSDGKIWLENGNVYGNKQADRSALKILSSVNAGLYGTMRAQFRVPRLIGDDNKSIDGSGFMLHSDNAAQSYLMLNVYANADGNLIARVCFGSSCQESALAENGRVYSTDIVTMSATIRSATGSDYLDVETITGYMGNYRTATATFELSSLDGYGGTLTNANEFVGFSLSSPDFVLYDIGWKSKTYERECWDSYPTVRCSFKAAYEGGVVPKDSVTRPWVGLSSWFDRKDCTPQYWYNGDDACGRSTTGEYSECFSDSYVFDAEGAHGVTSVENNVTTETRMAMAMVQNCAASLSDENRALLYAEQAKCGSFWVGHVELCNEKLAIFPTNTDNSRVITTHTKNAELESFDAYELFALSDATNMRSARLKVLLANEFASEAEIYLRSQVNGSPNVYYSKPVVTTGNGTVLNINVDDVSDVEGFDSEHVTGVIVRNLGAYQFTVEQIHMDCDFVPRVECRDVEYDANKFKVTVNVKNSNRASSYEMTVKENNQLVDDLKITQDCSAGECLQSDDEDNILLVTKEYNPYAINGAKEYLFTVSMKNDAGEEVENSPYTISLSLTDIAASCKWNEHPGAGPYHLAQGAGFPPFLYSLTCPEGKSCSYEILLDNEKIYEGTGNTSGYSSLPTSVTNSINTKQNPLADKSEHTLVFRSSNDAATFPACTKTFKITKPAKEKVECSLSNAEETVAVSDGGESMAIPASSVTVTGCDDGGCTYTIKDGAKIVGSGTFNNGYNLYFDGATEAGVHNYKVTIKRGTEADKPCGGTYKVTYTGAASSSSAESEPSSSAGSDSEALPLTTTFSSYSAGTYTLKTGNLKESDPKTLHCDVASDAPTDRTIGSLGSCTIMIPRYNKRSNQHGCTVTGNTTYTFVVQSGAPSDLTCGLAW